MHDTTESAASRRTLPSFEKEWAGRLFKTPQACKVSGIGRTKLFALLAAGEVAAKRHGGVNLVIGESLGRYVDGLPVWQPGASPVLDQGG
jgi:hypothetical protein